MATISLSLPRVLTVKEIAKRLGVHRDTIYKMVHKGELPGFRVGNKWRFNAEKIDSMVQQRAPKSQRGQDHDLS